MKNIKNFVTKFGEVSNIVIEEYYLEFYLKINFFNLIDVRFTFEEFEVSKQEEEIKKYIQTCIDTLQNQKNTILKSIKNYAKDEYAREITEKDFLNKKIYITSIYFSDECSKDTYCINLNTFFEKEHAMGIVFKNKNILQIGYADVCFSKF